MELAISQFAAWSPTRQSEEDWQHWANDSSESLLIDHADDNVKKPKTAAVPAMTRRRLTLWGAMAMEVACQVAEHIDAKTPTIFASRHGDTQRTYTLLESISRGEPLSPTAFSLSVHNSSSGMFSILQKVLANALALAAGKETLAHAFLEAENLLNQGHSKVLLVNCDQPLANFYKPYADEVEQPHAFAMVIEAKNTQGPTTQLSVQNTRSSNTNRASNADNGLSLSMTFLKFWYSGAEELDFDGRRLSWHFARKPAC